MTTPRVLLCAAGSGSGKTTITCGLLQAFVNRGLKTAAFKCGPDYIDPMFHSRVIGAKSRNLDGFFAEPELLRALLRRNSEGCDISALEGVMGYYDGVANTSLASSYAVARDTDTPAVLIVNARGMSVSAAAIVKGFLAYQPDSHIQGVLLNQVSPSLYPELKTVIEDACGIPVLGFLPKAPELALESRHLGLVMPGEIDDIREKLQKLAAKLEETVDIGGILSLARSAPELHGEFPLVPRLSEPVTIAVAQDDAFCFYYEDNLQLLRDMGAETVPFSPISDTELPPCDGLLLGGGYPELYGKTLSENASMRASISRAIGGGMPCIAECGGFLYLHAHLTDMEGNRYPMCGVVPGGVYYTGKLRRFGYVQLTAQEDSLLGPAGTTLRGHEFHYFDSENNGSSFRAEKPVRGTNWPCIHGAGDLLAGFPHLYFLSDPQCAEHYLRRCLAFKKQRK